jgi:hypothetical protein
MTSFRDADTVTHGIASPSTMQPPIVRVVSHVRTLTEAWMSRQRRETRFEVRDVEGVLRVLRDVVVHRNAMNELVAISSEAGLPGELVTLHLGTDVDVPTRIRVVESRPVVVDGQLRHHLRFSPVNGDESSTD